MITSKISFFMPETLSSEYKYIGKTAVQGKEDTFDYVYAYSINLDTVLKSYLNEINLENILSNIIKYKFLDYFSIIHNRKIVFLL